MTRTVFAIDVTTSVVSLSLVTETDGPAVPVVSWVDPPNAGGAHKPVVTWQKACDVADAVAAKVTASGYPTLVLMAKQQWGPATAWKAPGHVRASLPADPTAARRIQIHTMIEDRLHRAGVPVGEYPYITALKWARGYGEKGRGSQVMTELTAFAGKTWGVISRTEVGADEKDHPKPFRPAVAVLAALGAQAVGVEVTGVEVTEDRLMTLRGEQNKSIQWPRGLRLPDDVKAWERLHADPSRVWVTDAA